VESVSGTLASTIGIDNPFRYRGYYLDNETGFYYLNSRYYDPQVGRFINADGIVGGVGSLQGYNLFAYCMNNPVNKDDPSGHWPKWLKSAASAVINTIKKAVSAVVNSAKSAISPISKPTLNVVKTSPNSLPKTGDPGSSKTLPNPDGTPKQKRRYGPDGTPERDRDYNHPGNMPFPHDHEWKDGVRQPDHLPPDSSFEFSWEPVLGVGLVVVCGLGMGLVAADDATGVGVADDFLLGPLGAGAGKGLIMIFGR
jgi:RHS repeat-associated protein